MKDVETQIGYCTKQWPIKSTKIAQVPGA